jgi:UDPglucose--hexose-1-phosphate uridylyltransferase
VKGAPKLDLRVDPISGRQVVFAPRRAARPGALRPTVEEETAEDRDRCPFDEGREGRTPPETFALPDGRQPDAPGWTVRVVPNLYPAFERQEVVVHSPRHVTSLADLGESELSHVAAAWRARAAAAGQEGFSYVHAVVNEGKAAGASLPHSHSQLVWLDSPPPAVEAERRGGDCPVCEVVSDAELQLEPGVVVHPAGRAPYELLIAPVEHDEDGFESAALEWGLAALARSIRRLHTVEGRVPLNAWLHAEGHWHFEVVPRLTVFAGVELGAGIYVNPLPPEQAAQALRQGTP